MLRPSVFAALIGLSARAYGQVSTVCPSTDICYSLNIPSSTASSGTGDIFFQLSGPSSLQWMGLGQGSSMSGANIFVIYASASGTNVTLSPRHGSGEVMPTYSSSAQVTLLEGSGIIDGKMIANVRCTNCNSWNGGSMDFTGSSGNWIHASRSGSALNTDDTSATISQHGNDYGAFSWSFSSAKGGNDVNPFVSSNGATTAGAGATSSSCVPRPSGTTGSGSGSGSVTGTGTWPSTMPHSLSSSWPTQLPTEWSTQWPSASPTHHGGDDGGDDDSGETKRYIDVYIRQTINYCSSDSNNGALTVIEEGEEGRTMLIAHGVIASLAFVVFFPFGAIGIRLLSFPGLVWLHGAFQVLSYLLYTAAFGLGVYIANEHGYMKETHPRIGIAVFVLLFFQPILGILHHISFKKIGRRGIWSHAHLWLGRGAITLGIINGGLGLKLAGNSKTGEIVYGVVAGVIWLVWMAAAVLGEIRRARAPAPSKLDGASPVASRRGNGRDGGNVEYYGNSRKSRN